MSRLNKTEFAIFIPLMSLLQKDVTTQNLFSSVSRDRVEGMACKIQICVH